jgi:hypothetical protein
MAGRQCYLGPQPAYYPTDVGRIHPKHARYQRQEIALGLCCYNTLVAQFALHPERYALVYIDD